MPDNLCHGFEPCFAFQPAYRLTCPACGADKFECAEMLEGNMTLTCGGCKKTFFLEWVDA